MTQCNQTAFAFAPHFSRRVSARFSERQLSTEGGALLLREVDRKISLLSRVSKCFCDDRQPWLIEHVPRSHSPGSYGHRKIGGTTLMDIHDLLDDTLPP